MNQQPENNSNVIKNEFRRNDPRWSQYGPTGFSSFLDQLAKRLQINVETFLVGAISLLLISLALLLDKLPLFLLSLLLAPIISPILGFAFGFNLGLFRFLRIGFLSFLLNFVSIFIVGIFSGFIARQFPEREFQIWENFIKIDWSGLLLIIIGILIMISTIIRNPRQASLVANVALAYSFYLPLVSSGFALGLGKQFEFITALVTFFQYLGISIITGVIVLLVYRIHPYRMSNWWGMISLVVLILSVIFVNLNPNLIKQANLEIPEIELLPAIQSTSISTEQLLNVSTKSEPTIEAILNQQIESTSIVTLIPTSTATITLTPLPTVIWAEVRSPVGDGANIREEPGFSARIVRTVLNGTPVQILDEVEVVEGATWIHIRFIDQVDGWIVRDLVISATPEPEW